MYHSYTHFRTKGLIGFLLFQIHALRSGNQAHKSAGLLKMKVWKGKGPNFHTLTSWKNKESMLAYRNIGAHLKAMKASSRLGEGYTVGWTSADSVTKKEAETKLWQKMQKIKPEWLTPAFAL